MKPDKLSESLQKLAEQADTRRQEIKRQMDTLSAEMRDLDKAMSMLDAALEAGRKR